MRINGSDWPVEFSDMRNLKNPLEIGILLYPGAQTSAVLGVTDLLMLADRLARQRLGQIEPALRVSHLKYDAPEDRGHRIFDNLPSGVGAPAFIVIPPYVEKPASADLEAKIIGSLRAYHAAGTKLAAICGGTFLLGLTGLVKGRVVTSHYSLVSELAREFPELNVDPDRVLVDNGDVITAGGYLSWIDLGLHLINRTLGPVASADTSRFLLVDRLGNNRHHYNVFTPKLEHGDKAILKSQNWIAQRQPRRFSTHELAAVAGLEERTFLRRFQKATGLKPQEYCQHLRIAKARELLSERRGPIEAIAWEVGYENLGPFRRSFFRLTGLNPAEYRRRFGSGM